MSEEDAFSSSGIQLPSTPPSHQQMSGGGVDELHWRGVAGGGAGSRSGGPRSLLLKRSENGFGFTLRHFIVYPPDTFNVLVPGCRGRGLEPMDTMFVKSVRPDSPASRAGLQTGDRVVSVNGHTVSGALTYAHVVHMISQSPTHLHLLVVPRQDDLLQLYFGETAHNPETNPRVRLRSPSPSPRQHSTPPTALSHSLSHSPQRHLSLTNAASSSLGGRSECSSLSLEAGGGEWRRASDGGGGGGVGEVVGEGGLSRGGRSQESSASSLDSRDFHSSDDSLIIDRIRKSFEQKEEFLRRGVGPGVGPGAAPMTQRERERKSGGGVPVWPAAIPASACLKLPMQMQTPSTAGGGAGGGQNTWRIAPAGGGGKKMAAAALTRIEESGSGGGLVPVSARAQHFELSSEGERERAQLFRSELAGLSEKRSAPDVALRRRHFEECARISRPHPHPHPLPHSPSSDEVVAARRAASMQSKQQQQLQSRSLDMPGVLSGNRVTPVGGGRLHCEPPLPLSPTSAPSSLGGSSEEREREREREGERERAQRHKAVRQDSYLAACHKPAQQPHHTQPEGADDVGLLTVGSSTSSSSASSENRDVTTNKKKKLKSWSSPSRAVRPTRLDIANVARPAGGQGLTVDNKDDCSSKQSPIDELQTSDGVGGAEKRRLSYVKSSWSGSEGASQTVVSSSPSVSVCEDGAEECERGADEYACACEGSMLCKVEQLALAEGKSTNINTAHAHTRPTWRPVWAVLRANTLYLLPDKQTPGSVGGADVGLGMGGGGEEVSVCVSGACVSSCNDISGSKLYQQQPQVLKVSTKLGSELLLQPQQPDQLQRWLIALSSAASASASSLQLQSNNNNNSNSQVQLQSDKSDKAARKPSDESCLNQQQQQQQPSPKCKTWKGRVAKQFRRIGGAQGGGSSPLSPTAPPPFTSASSANASYPEGASIGVPLELCPQSMQLEFVPLLVEECCSAVESRGLDVVGVYRVPGNTAAVAALTDAVNRCTSPHSSLAALLAAADVNVVSSLLKSLLRRLPDSLLTSRLYPLFIAADKITDPLLRAATIRKLVHSLPDHHFETLRVVVMHLRRVVANCHVNKMEARNVAIVFGPTLVRTAADSMLTLVTDMSHQCRIVETLILHADWFFSDDDIDKLELSSAAASTPPPDSASGSGSAASAGSEPPISLTLADNHSLLLENINKVQGMSRSSESSSACSLKDNISAKDIVVSIIGAANRKMHKATAKSRSSSKHVVCATPTTAPSAGGGGDEADSGGGRVGVASSIRESVLLSGKILATPTAAPDHAHTIKNAHAQSRAALRHNNTTDGSDGVRLKDGGGMEAVEEGEGGGSLSQQSVDADGMIRTYTGLSACTQERIRRFEQETKAMLQRCEGGSGSGSGSGRERDERSKRELREADDYTSSSSMPAIDIPAGGGEDLLSSLTSTFDAKMRSLWSGTASAQAVDAECRDTTAAAATAVECRDTAECLCDEQEEVEEKEQECRDTGRRHCGQTKDDVINLPAYRDPSLHRSGHHHLQVGGVNCKSDQQQQERCEERTKCAEVENTNNNNNNHSCSRMKKEMENAEEEGEEKKDDSAETKDPLSSKQHANSCQRLRRSDSLQDKQQDAKRGRGGVGGGAAPPPVLLKRSDSLTKSEKTESNLSRRAQQGFKRKNGGGGSGGEVGGRWVVTGGGGGGGRCSIKRRHTVGGTKDFDWATPPEPSANRRTSSPDLSAARTALLLLVTHSTTQTAPPPPLESHV